jgi:hypothetical protein
MEVTALAFGIVTYLPFIVMGGSAMGPPGRGGTAN